MASVLKKSSTAARWEEAARALAVAAILLAALPVSGVGFGSYTNFPGVGKPAADPSVTRFGTFTNTTSADKKVAADIPPEGLAAWSEGLPPEMALEPVARTPGHSYNVSHGRDPTKEKSKPQAQVDPVRARAKTIYGIAAKYTDDVGLEKDPSVVFKHDFDDGEIRHTLTDDWCGLRWGAVSRISSEEPVSGKHCLVNSWGPRDDGGSASRWFLEKLTGRERPMYFMRLYHKFDEGWYGEGKVLGMKGFGFIGWATKCPATVPCDGRNWFTSEMQWVGYGPSAKPDAYKGMLVQGHYYSYSTVLNLVCPTMNDELKINDNPGGGAPYRFSAYTKPFTWLKLGEWYCFEVGILMNTPGQSDGEGCFWINGKLETRTTHMRYYDLKDAFKLYATIQQYRTQTDNTTAPEVKRFVDNLVVARRYIGPIRFSEARLQYFRNNGIVVHGEDEQAVESMRRAHASKRPDTQPGRPR